jgi:HEAT repeat protein
MRQGRIVERMPHHLSGRLCAFAVAAALCSPFGSAQEPVDRDAVETRIGLHAAKGQMQLALEDYDAYVRAAKRSDVGLLRPVAMAELGRLVQNHPNDPLLYPGALERLARAGDVEAQQSLKRAAAASPPIAQAIESIAALVRLGDEEAARRFEPLLRLGSTEDKVRVIQAIERSNARGLAASVAALLGDPEIAVRRTAARAVGLLQYREAAPQLRALVERDAPIVQMFAAPALKRLGDTSVDAFVAKMLASESPEMRLEAAAAYPQSSRAPWIDRVKALGTDRNPLARIRAAEALACCAPEASRAILSEALRDPLPPMRVEAARVYELEDLADGAVARRLLGDSSDHVRLHGAGAVLRQIAKPARKK